MRARPSSPQLEVGVLPDREPGVSRISRQHASQRAAEALDYLAEIGTVPQHGVSENSGGRVRMDNHHGWVAPALLRRGMRSSPA